ncbi:MAG: glycosyltransferase family 2 protein [Desulfovibrio sp.]
MLTSTIIIPTYNRPGDLNNCVASLLAQTRLPEEVVVVDDGDLPGFPLEAECRAAGIRCVYMQKDVPGLTESRNVGVSLATQEIIFFLDDDVVLEPEYVAEILRVYEQDKSGRIGGVGGVMANKKPLGVLQKIRRVVNILFFVSGWREGRVLPSGFCSDFGTTPFPLSGEAEVDFLDGGVCSYRHEVFDHFSFTDHYRKYGFGEDKDFSYSVSRRYTLVLTPLARLDHLESAVMRPDLRTWGRKFIMGRYLFFRKYVYTGWWSLLFFGWAVFGYTLDRLTIALLMRSGSEWDRVCGIGDAVRLIFKGGVSLHD